MSLTSNQIENALLDGLTVTGDGREFVARLNTSESVVVTEMTRLARIQLPLEFILDKAEANESGSRLASEADLRQLVGELAAKAM